MSDKSLGRPPHSSVVLNIKLESPRVLFSSARLSVSLQSPVTSLYTSRQGWQWSLTPPQIQEWTGSQVVPWPRCPWTSSVSLLCVDAVWSSDCWVSYTTATLKHPVTKEAIVGKGVCASAKQTISGNSPHFKLCDSYSGQLVMGWRWFTVPFCF